MTCRLLLLLITLMLACIKLTAQLTKPVDTKAWIRINQLGYLPDGPKTAVWCSKKDQIITSFYVIEINTGNTVLKGNTGPAFGAYGPFAQTYRLNFSRLKKPGNYVIRAGDAVSPEFIIEEKAYEGVADFCLRYMRQQRSGYNPFLKDSCHTYDGYTMYGPMPDSTHIDVSGGWHDASDYLQYVTTSANATWHLLAAYRDFPEVFSDRHLANGLAGSNNRPDVLDEAKWGLDWLLKMHPREDWMFNQLGDDRDHAGMRIPKEDSFYGKGYERPVYFATGQPQGLFKYKNRATGVASTAGKFSSAFALGFQLMSGEQADYKNLLFQRARSAYRLGIANPGVCQTAPGRAPYFYEEDNWTDDMQLAAASLRQMEMANGQSPDDGLLKAALQFAKMEKITPWLGGDTARHYQWYPFINLGHFELAKQLVGKPQKETIEYFKQGIEKVWQRSANNAFYRGIPFIWCSNNLTTAFAIQCYWYRQLSGDADFLELEQANFDWLFGCNPWGTSMVYGLPANGDTPTDPHSAFTHLKQYPIDGGLVDGPVYGSIFKNLIGITLNEPDEYAAFQSDLVVYHDDYGDYSTNEPTMDGTASLIYLLAAKEQNRTHSKPAATGRIKRQVPRGYKMPVSKNTSTRISYNREKGGVARAITRGDTSRKQLAIVFTGDEFGDGGPAIINTLKNKQVKASFFLTGRFYRTPSFGPIIRQLKEGGHYLGAHSDQHLLYCDWNKRDSLLVTQQEFESDLLSNYTAMSPFLIEPAAAPYFLPPYEWYNDSISSWTKQAGFQLINYTPGTISHADYTTPDMKNYRSSDQVLQSIYGYNRKSPAGLNGFILLLHIGTAPQRTDKLYNRLDELINYLTREGYEMVRIDQLLQNH
ncbi:glycoside hydrolase family 9 protein [Paraflavitalea pollutisoli]|uniref:glycoside hydrolase family 9 protein n=1 Tax=Paraflavitalea pollutisoli TaxID=3034143 RepID=UPI0023EC5490|nr:glycoside hydrolase family 9 protein [Paraflavitalea sp. H1-2-19X]